MYVSAKCLHITQPDNIRPPVTIFYKVPRKYRMCATQHIALTLQCRQSEGARYLAANIGSYTEINLSTFPLTAGEICGIKLKFMYEMMTVDAHYQQRSK